MLWTTDEQGFTEYEYKAVKTACDAIEHYEYSNGTPNFDCHLNTGDISQNANRPQEWRYYYKYHEDNLKNMPHILNCGWFSHLYIAIYNEKFIELLETL